MKVLLIDDSRTMRNIQKKVLSANPRIEFAEAGDGVEALSVIAATPGGFDLLIVDWNMPNMDGISFVKAVKQMPNYRFTPIIMLTTESGDGKKREGQAAGAKAWVVKPFKAEALLGAVRTLCLP